MAASPHLGFGPMRNVDIESYPGAIIANRAPASLFESSFSKTFTAADTDICTVASGAPQTGRAVTLTTTGTLPGGLSTGTVYFAINLNGTTFKLATTKNNADAGTAVNISDAGTGIHTITSVNPGSITHIRKSAASGVHFFMDSNCRVWYLESGATVCYLLLGNTLTSGAGNGMVLFRNSANSATYLIAFRDAKADIVNVTTTTNLGAPTWTNSWIDINTSGVAGESHHAIVGQDNVIYYVDDRYVGSITEVGTFDPSNSATYTLNTNALDLPQGESATWLEEQGIYLLVAGGSYNLIYPWDRLSDSFELPLVVPETSIKKLKNIGNVVYILAGNKGNIYITQGNYVTLFAKLPEHVINNSATVQAGSMTWGGISMRNGALLVGVGGLTTANNGAWLIYPDGRMIIDSQPSSGATNATALYADNEFYFMGYATGADYISTSRQSSYGSVVQSGMIQVGTKTEKASYASLEVQTASAITGGNIRIGYRTGTRDSFTTLSTFTTDTTNTSFEDKEIGLTDIENAEFQIEFDGEIVILELRVMS